MVPYSGETTSPLIPLHIQSDDSEREDTGLSQQIDFLTTKNQQLQKQLEEREQERDRLREQLETQRADKGYRSIYSPPGLPSRVLDGRKVLRDSVPLVTSPGIPSSSSPVPSDFCSSPLLPLSPVPWRVASPLSPSAYAVQSPTTSSASQQTATPSSSLPHSPRARGPIQSKDYSSSGTGLSKRANADEFILPRPDAISSERQLQQQLDALKRSNFELEKRLRELVDEKRRMEAELKSQDENFMKMQAREQDLLKDIEVLRDENSHHSGAIKRLQGEREGLQGENETLQDDVGILNDKLNKTEKYYKEVEHENLTLEADIKQLIKDKKQLFEEKQKLQIAVESALKTKENYRSTIKQLREQNQSLEVMIRPDLGQPKTSKPEKKKVVVPATKEQKALSEVMNLREEKLQLRDRLFVAQQEIDSLEAHLKGSDKKDGLPCVETQDGIEAHLCLFQSQVDAVHADLDAVKSTVSLFSSQQQVLMHDSFLLLASKCREQLTLANKDRSKLSETLRETERSLAKMDKDFEVLRSENAVLKSQKTSMVDDVTALKEQVAILQDQKRMQAVQLAQNEAIAHEKDEKIVQMEHKQRQLQERYSTSERNWKREYGKLELEWEGKVAEALQRCELLSEEKEQLLTEKYLLESKLGEVTLDNEKLAIAKNEVELQAKQLEEKMVDIMLEVDEKEQTISGARQDIACLLVQRTLLLAQVRLDQEDSERKLTSLQEENAQALACLHTKSDALQEVVSSLTSEKSGLLIRLEEIAGKERHIDMLESKIAILTSSQTQLQSEMDMMSKKHSKVIQEFRLLEDAEHTRRLDNEKLKMTLTTEIKLLKSKLSSVDDERSKLQQMLSEISSEHQATPHSAFRAISSGKQVEQMRKQIVMLQSENKQLSLKSSASVSSSSSHTALDEEAVTTLRKRVAEMTRKTFFLESDKKNLTDKVKSLATSLKSAREAKDHVTSEHIQKLQEENKSLRERVHNLEGNLTKKLMAADSKIVETVKENDKLRLKLQTVQSALSSEQCPSSELDSFLTLLKSESEALLELKASLASSSGELEALELGHQRIEDLHQEIQLTISAEDQPMAMASLPASKSIPAVFKSLPAEYISNLQGHKDDPPRLGSRSLSFSAASDHTDLQKKMSEINSVTTAFGETFQKHKSTLERKDTEVGSLHERLVALEEKFKSESKRSNSLKDVLFGIQGLEHLKGEQLQAVMQKQIEQLQDQVIDRDSALSDIEMQMKLDFELHHKKFTMMKSQVIDLREQLSSCSDMLRSKDQYIQKTEDRCLGLEAELFKTQKELERVALEQKELVNQGLPESLQMRGMASVTDVIRIQSELIVLYSVVVLVLIMYLGKFESKALRTHFNGKYVSVRIRVSSFTMNMPQLNYLVW